jgi:integrase
MPSSRKKRLTAALAASLKKPGKYHDGSGTGLYLQVEKSGSKSWVQRVMVRGKRREIGLGSLSLVGLAKARDIAIDHKRLIRDGGDPIHARKTSKHVMTFEEAAHAVHANGAKGWTNPKHANQFINTLHTYVFQAIGRRLVSEIDSADVLAVLQPIWLEKSETARRVKQRIGKVLKYAIAQGWRTDNPAEQVSEVLPRQGDTPRNFKSLPYTEVASCIHIVRNSKAAPTTKLALEFAILTASRPGAVRLAPWSEVDLDRRVWIIPPGRRGSKIAKKGRPHIVPLTARCIAILAEAEALRDKTGLVFPSPMGAELSDMTFTKLLHELGFDIHMHGFRTSFRTWCQERTSYPREACEMALAHTVKNKVEAAYARSDYLEIRTAMMQDWSSYLANIGANKDVRSSNSRRAANA